MQRKSDRGPLIVEQMEPRILYSSDLFPLAAATLHGAGDIASPDHLRHHAAPVQHAVVSSVSTPTVDTGAVTAAQRVVFIDSSVAGHDALAAKLQSADGLRQDVVLIDAEKSGIAQISAALEGRHGLNAVHIISNGTSGDLRIGSTSLNPQSLMTHAASISQWGDALSHGADITLTGSDAAGTQEGQALMAGLQQLTGATVSADNSSATAQDIEASAKAGLRMSAKATFTVTSTADSGAGSLRAAITAANAAGGTNTINFNIAGSGVQTINLASALPTVTSTVIIDGSTEGGFSGTPLVELNGASAGGGVSGLTLTSGAAGSTINDLIIDGFKSNGIYLNNVSNVSVTGNYIGINAAGNGAVANDGSGIYIDGTSSNDTIGGTSSSAANVISGNANSGISINGNADANTIEGNEIGTNAGGTAAVANQSNGITVGGNAVDNVIGGTGAGAENLISGNSSDGIYLTGTSSGTAIEGNYIGTDITSVGAIANGDDGIYIDSGISGIVVGGTSAGARNIISGNANDGIEIAGSNNFVEGNYIGTDVSSTLGNENYNAGIELVSGANGNTIGGTAAGDGNVISANGNASNSPGGIAIYSANNIIQGNYIGTDATGTRGVENGGFLDGNVIGILVGSGATNNTIGGTVAGARNIISYSYDSGIELTSSSNNTTVQGNFIGTNGAGSSAIGNRNDGILVDSGSTGNIIGGTAAGAGNIISGNGFSGIEVYGNTTTIEGNIVGLDATGTFALANSNDGIFIAGADNVVGGTATGAGNVISGNGSNGIESSTSAGTTIEGNIVGLDQTGSNAVGNGGDGIFFDSGDNGSMVGGTSTSARNIISGNVGDGIEVAGGNEIIAGNYIGTNAAGSAAVGNESHGIELEGNSNLIGGTTAGSGNVISGNTRDGILISSNNNTVAGNYVGLSATGGNGAGNGGEGIAISAGTNNVIGGTTTAARNIVSANGQQGIGVTGSSTSNTIEGNFVGTDPTGESAVANGWNGIYINASGNTVGGSVAGAGNLVSGNLQNGIALDNASNVTVEGNQVGTDAAGTSAIGNQEDGIALANSSDNNTIGGTARGDGNVVSGNAQSGISLKSSSTGNTALGNLVGVDATGSAALGNGDDGFYVAANGNTIGGTAAGSANVASGNGRDGINLQGASNTTIEGNFLGTDATGNNAIGNLSNGIELASSSDTNTIGGTVAGAENIVSGNDKCGISIESSSNGNTVEGNLVGTNAAGTSALGNQEDGIYVNSSGNTVGGTVAGSANVVSGNRQNGIALDNATNNLFEGNLVGTDLTGSNAIGNQQNGIQVTNSSDNNTIGGTVAGAGNLVSGNVESGITFESASTGNIAAGNLVGVNAADTAALANEQYGFYITAQNNIVGGTVAGSANVISGNDQAGVFLTGASGNVVEGNVIGTNAAGTTAIGNQNNGVSITNSATNNTIGGTTAAARNIISGNTGNGIALENDGDGNTVEGNYIGTNAAGTGAIANSHDGIYDANNGNGNNLIGGTTAGAGNVISGNGSDGIEIAGSFDLIEGNYVGTNAAGNAAVPNQVHGIELEGNDNVVGGTAAGAGNVLSGNHLSGVEISGNGNTVEGNKIGTDAGGTNAIANQDGVKIAGTGSNNVIGGTAAGAGNLIADNSFRGVYVASAGSVGNQILGNSITGNGELGIDLDPSGANNLQAAPTLSTVVDVNGNIFVSGTLSSSPSSTYRIEFFSNSSEDPSGAGQGQTFLGYIVVTTNSAGIASFSGVLSTTAPYGAWISATATNQSTGNTSKFAADVQVPPASAPGGTNNTVTTNENSSYTFSAADFGYNDPDGNTLLAVEITTLPTAGTLTDNGVAIAAGTFVSVADINAGKLVFTPVADSSGSGYAGFTFQVQDNGGTANGKIDTDPVARTMTINVSYVNQAPSGTSGSISTAENTTYTFTLADFGFTDPNIPANTLLAVWFTTLPSQGTLEWRGAPFVAGDYVVASDIAAGELTFVPAANGYGSGYASFTFQVQNNGGTANGGVDMDPTPKTMTVNVVEQAPAGTSNTVTTPENTAYTFSTADFGFTDLNGLALSSVEISTLPGAGTLTDNGVAVSAGAFVSVADLNAGKLVFTPAANGSGNGYSNFTFQVQDSSGATDPTPKTMTFNVTPSPPSGASNTVTAQENSAYTFTAANFGFSDVNGTTLSAVEITTLPGAGTLTDNGVAVSAGTFVSVADINAGKLVFTPAVNGSGNGYSSFTFQVQDSSGATDPTPKAMTINVTAQTPAGTSNTVTTQENTAYTFTAADFGFTDINGTTLSSVEITTLPGAGTLTDNGVAVSAGAFVSVADINAGKLTYTPAANGSGNGYSSFAFQVEDNSGATDPTPRTMTFNVTAVPPSGTSNTVTAQENGSYTFTAANFGFSDVNGTTLSAVEITTLPGAGTLTDNGVAVSAGTFVSVADINAGKLVFTPAANGSGNGYAGFTFQVQDSSGATDPTARTMTINVAAQTPAGTSNTVTVQENGSYTFTTADFGFSDVNGTTLSAVEITTLPGAGTLTDNGVAVSAGTFVSVADINAGKLVYTPAANGSGNGYSSFTFQVEDNSGATDPTPRTMTFNVTSVPPSGASNTVTAQENGAYTFTAANFGFSDVNGTTLSAVEITTLPGAGSLTDNGVAVAAGTFVSVADINAGKLVFTPAANGSGNGYAGFTFQVQDSSGATDPTARTMTINVAAQTPAGTSNTVTVQENGSYTFTTADFGFSDINGTTLSAVEITTLPGAGTLTDNGVAVSAGAFVSVADINAGKLVYTPAANGSGNGYSSFAFQVEDNSGATDPTARTMTFNVTAVPPSGASNTVTVQENGTYTFTAANFGFSDVNGTALSAVEITTLPGAGSLTDNGVAVAAGTFVSVADINAGKLVFTPAANASGNDYASFTFQVQDSSGTIDPTARTMTLNVTAQTVTVTPPAGANNTVTVQENGSYTFGAADFGFTDSNGATLSAVEITTLPGAGTLTDNGVPIGAGYVVSVADINAGKLVFTPTANTSGNGYAGFTFQVEDSVGGVDPTPRTMTFNVTPQLPAGSNNTVTIQENGSYTFGAGDFGFSDVNGTTLSAVEIITLPGNGSLTDNGIAVAAGSFVSVADINAGKLVFTPTGDASGNNYAGFSFQVQDSSGAIAAKPSTMTFNVTPLPPAGTNNSVTAQENGTYTFSVANFGFTDVNGTTLAAVEITTLPNTGSLTLNGVAVGTGMFVSVADIDAGKLVYTPAANTSGSDYASFTFQVRDSNGNVDPHAKTIAVNVTPGSTGPTGSTGSTGTGGSTGTTGSTGSVGVPGSGGNGDGSATHNIGTGTTGSTATTGTGSNSTGGSGSTASGSATVDSVAVNLTPGGLNASAPTSGGDTSGAGTQSSAGSPSDAGASSQTNTGSTQSTPSASSVGLVKPLNIVAHHNQGSASDAEEGDSSMPGYEATYFSILEDAGGITGNPLFAGNWNLGLANRQYSPFALSFSNASSHHRASTAPDHEAGAGDAKIVMEETRRHAAELRSQAMEVAGAVSSLGLIWIAGREAALAASFLAAVPAWQRIDPLPLFEKDDENAAEEEDTLDIADHLFSNINASSQKMP